MIKKTWWKGKRIQSKTRLCMHKYMYWCMSGGSKNVLQLILDIPNFLSFSRKFSTLNRIFLIAISMNARFHSRKCSHTFVGDSEANRNSAKISCGFVIVNNLHFEENILLAYRTGGWWMSSQKKQGQHV